MADIEAIRGRLAGMGNVQWKQEGAGVFAVTPSGKQWQIAQTDDGFTRKGAIAEFIAHAPEDIAALLTQVDEMQRALNGYIHYSKCSAGGIARLQVLLKHDGVLGQMLVDIAADTIEAQRARIAELQALIDAIGIALGNAYKVDGITLDVRVGATRQTLDGMKDALEDARQEIADVKASARRVLDDREAAWHVLATDQDARIKELKDLCCALLDGIDDYWRTLPENADTIRAAEEIARVRVGRGS